MNSSEESIKKYWTIAGFQTFQMWGFFLHLSHLHHYDSVFSIFVFSVQKVQKQLMFKDFQLIGLIHYLDHITIRKLVHVFHLFLDIEYKHASLCNCTCSNNLALQVFEYFNTKVFLYAMFQIGLQSIFVSISCEIVVSTALCQVSLSGHFHVIVVRWHLQTLMPFFYLKWINKCPSWVMTSLFNHDLH